MFYLVAGLGLLSLVALVALLALSVVISRKLSEGLFYLLRRLILESENASGGKKAQVRLRQRHIT
ncbi:MAG: hypothetical protein ACE5HL_07985 [Terriglobia bacterium]